MRGNSGHLAKAPDTLVNRWGTSCFSSSHRHWSMASRTMSNDSMPRAPFAGHSGVLLSPTRPVDDRGLPREVDQGLALEEQPLTSVFPNQLTRLMQFGV
jgi:hypothetical protein